jgi:Xaa-Pro aminopeptidase
MWATTKKQGHPISLVLQLFVSDADCMEGFVLTNEPGIYFIPALIDQWQKDKTNADFINFDEVNKYRNFGGIRLEDDILVTKTGSEL